MKFREHPACVPPQSDEQKIWRYMDFTKFVSMLSRRCLYLTSLQRMADQDPFEGLLPDAYFQFRSWKIPDDVPEHERWRLTLYQRPGMTHLEMAKSSMEDLIQLVYNSRKTMYVNCWHMNNYDSTAMWSIYAGRGSGIAITSRFNQLEEALKTEKSIFSSKIIYSDYSTEDIPNDLSNNLMTPVARKRRSFEFERELRIFFWDDTYASKHKELATAKLPSGVEIPCDLDVLIDEIFVSPKAEAWFLDLVQSVVQTYGLDKVVRRSTMDAQPMR